VMIVVGREFAVTGLRNVAANRGILIPASGLGKGKMVAQVVCISLLLLGLANPVFRLPGLVALWVVVGLALVSGAEYFRQFWRGTTRAANDRP